jgi:tetratricopeptide (TPR) repeat protein
MHFLSKIGTEDKNITLETKFSKENTIKTNIQPNELENTQRTNQEKSHIIIERKETKNDINEIIKRFKKNHNPALSLFIAKKYYELGDYHKAYNYALITNQINEDIEDSWIIFAKSLVKMKKKNTAVKTLREYIRYSHSSSAEILLNEILSGKFR